MVRVTTAELLEALRPVRDTHPEAITAGDAAKAWGIARKSAASRLKRAVQEGKLKKIAIMRNWQATTGYIKA